MNQSEVKPRPPFQPHDESRVVKVEFKSAYGNERIYPANDKAELFCELSGKKTLSRDDIKTIKLLGFRVEVVTPEIEGL
jgi:hypothetical protein